MKFFIPLLKDDPEAAEVEWTRYLREISSPPNSRRVYSMTYETAAGSEKLVVTVGKERMKYRRPRSPRNADFQRNGTPTGTVVSGIVDDGQGSIHVFSYGPPFGGWHNPSLVARGEVKRIEYFDEQAERDGT